MLKNMGYAVAVTQYIVIKPSAACLGERPAKPPQ